MEPGVHKVRNGFHRSVNTVDRLLVRELLERTYVVSNCPVNYGATWRNVSLVVVATMNMGVDVFVAPRQMYHLVCFVVMRVVDVCRGSASWCYALTIHKQRHMEIGGVGIYCKQSVGI